MILSGCGHFAAPPAKSNGFQLSRECEHLAANVDDPIEDGRITQQTDPKLAVGEYRVALGQANDNLTATRTCQQDQRARVAKGSAK